MPLSVSATDSTLMQLSLLPVFHASLLFLAQHSGYCSCVSKPLIALTVKEMLFLDCASK